MIHPLKGKPRLTNPFGKAGKTEFYDFHDGEDWGVFLARVYAPEGGDIKYYWSVLGGRTIKLTAGNNEHKFHHLSKVLKTGIIKEGQLIAISGNSGKWTTGFHLHWGLKIKGKLVRPSDYINKGGLTMSQYSELKRGLSNRFKEIQGIWKTNEKQEKDIRALKKEVKALKSRTVKTTNDTTLDKIYKLLQDRLKK